jgi:hypothetical protein
MQRMRWLASIVSAAAQERIAAAWADRAVEDVTEPAVSHASVAVERAYGRAAWPPPGIHASDRVRRMADESAGRSLRSSARQISILSAMLPHMVPAADFALLSAADRGRASAAMSDDLPDDTTPVERRNLLRAVRSAEKAAGAMPSSAYDVLSPPSGSGAFVLPLDAADDQQVRLGDGSLSVLLPTAAAPGQRDWAWHTLPLDIPAWAAVRYASGAPCRPSLRVLPDRAYLLLPLDVPTPPMSAANRVLGLDWGQRRMLTGAVCSPDKRPGRVATTGRPFYFSASGMQSRLYHLRDEAEHLAAKIRLLKPLIAGMAAGDPERMRLEACLSTLAGEKDAAWRRLRNGNRQLARAAAAWVVETAIAEGCGAIAFEDLDSLEARELGRTTNGRVNLQVRGLLFAEIADRAALLGIRIVIVPAAGTSALCSRCGRASAFRHAPDRVSHKGRNNRTWVVCACGRSSDRDHNGAENIAARGLAMLALPASRPRRPRRATRAEAAVIVSGQPRARVRRDRRRRCQAVPLHIKHTEHAPRPRGERSPRRVGRGTGVAARQPVIQYPPVTAPAPGTRRVLDGLCGGYRSRVRFSRIRSLAPPPAQVGAGY